MRRREKKSCKQNVTTNYIILLTAIINLVIALIKLLDKLLD